MQRYCDGRFYMAVHFYTPYDQTVDRRQASPTNDRYDNKTWKFLQNEKFERW